MPVTLTQSHWDPQCHPLFKGHPSTARSFSPSCTEQGIEGPFWGWVLRTWRGAAGGALPQPPTGP